MADVATALEVTNLEVFYHRLSQVLRGVSLAVPDGGVVALLGPNGAGKTTVLRAISGLLELHDGDLRKGHVLLHGRDVTRAAAAEMVRGGLAQVLEGRQVFPTLSVDENLRTGGHTQRRHRNIGDDLDRVYTRFPRLAERRTQAAGYLSGGEQQMLAIGRALMAAPRILLLDEPSLGLAPKLVEEIGAVIRSINEDGTSVLLVEQNAGMALEIADHGYVLENGRVVMDAPAEKLLRDEDIREFYLGVHGSTHTNYREIKHYRRKKRWLS
ncbi:ABC transporter ATP-binding protein [Desertimonas flava]|uniref:ABC transporter ATP-binding protein n=1 Tax=Desertimonas flava TaxID=2064846 RepID=UPI001D0CB932|nr:ABC transporter ATP-binding protein [Desertimonas flava]